MPSVARAKNRRRKKRQLGDLESRGQDGPVRLGDVGDSERLRTTAVFATGFLGWCFFVDSKHRLDWSSRYAAPDLETSAFDRICEELASVALKCAREP